MIRGLCIAILLGLFMSLMAYPKIIEVQDNSESHYLYKSCLVSYKLKKRTIGRIRILQLPMSIYVLYDFFVFPKFRNKGYGTKIITFALKYIKKTTCRARILIQPGPFDMINGKLTAIQTGEERAKRLQLLLKLYQRVGFKTAPKAISGCMFVFYKLAGIDEDSNYLMIYGAGDHDKHE